MSTEARCRHCGKLLGTLDQPTALSVHTDSVQAAPGEIIFTVKCPRCGKTNHIKFDQ